MDLLLPKMLAFLSTFLLVVSLSGFILSRNKAVMQNIDNKLPMLFRLFGRQINSLGGFFQPIQESLITGWHQRTLGHLRAAALDSLVKLQDMAGAQLFVGLTAFGVSLLIVLFVEIGGIAQQVIICFVVGLAGWYYPDNWLRKTALDRQLTISRSLPYALDLATTAVEAGQDFGAALREITRECLDGPIAEEFGRLLRDMDLGMTRQEALRHMAERVGTDEMVRFASAIIQGMESGASLGNTLRMQAEDVRRERFHRAERKAARAPSLMTIPMLLFIVPGIFLIVLTPVILRMLVATGKLAQ